MPTTRKRPAPGRVVTEYTWLCRRLYRWGSALTAATRCPQLRAVFEARYAAVLAEIRAYQRDKVAS